MRLITLPTYTDERGSLTVMEKEPFEVKRVFWITGATRKRGQHSHKEGEQLIVAVHGSFMAYVYIDSNSWYYKLSSPEEGLYLPPEAWIELYDFSEDAVCLVLCSHHYDEEDIERGNSMDEKEGVTSCES